MEKKLIFRLAFAAILTVVFYACGTKKQATNEKKALIVFEPLAPKPIDTFRFSPQLNHITPLPKVLTVQDYYEAGYQELEAMLNGTKPADFERAVFISENPYYNNGYVYEKFQKLISLHLHSVVTLALLNDKSDTMNFSATVNKQGRFNMADIRYLPQEKKELYRKALTNWAIFTYITDTTAVYPFFNLPFTYAGHDPFGVKDWSNSQVIGLLLSDKQQGNCFALTAFYKILSDRLNSGARLCTAPQHIYIQHQDPKGDYYNVELATAGHPTDGTIQTLTYTTGTAIRSGISLRSYNEKQSIGLCLINLAKSYEHKFKTRGHEFLLRCAELALKHDSLNLNALLLKQQVLDEQVATYSKRNKMYEISLLKKESKIKETLLSLEHHTALLYRLGYREMPRDMQEIIMTGVYPNTVKNKNPSPFTTIDPKDPHRKEFQSSYNGLFQEVFEQKEALKYGHYIYSTKSNTVTALDTSAKSNMLIDPVAFAYDFGARMYDARLGRWMSLDPLMAKYTDLSPYNFAANSVILLKDADGREIVIGNVVYTPNMKVPADADVFTTNAIQALNFVYGIGAETKTKLDLIINSTEKVRIVQAQPGEKFVYVPRPSVADEKLYEATGDPIHLMPKIPYDFTQASTYVNGQVRPSIVGFSHELDHAYMHFFLTEQYKSKATELGLLVKEGKITELEMFQQLEPYRSAKEAFSYGMGGLEEEERATQGLETNASNALCVWQRPKYHTPISGFFRAKDMFSTEPSLVDNTALSTGQKVELTGGTNKYTWSAPESNIVAPTR